MKYFLSLLCLTSFFFFCGCGGGSSQEGMLLSGKLIQGGNDLHENLLSKHDAGQPIQNVKICALSECTLTDEDGAWGFVADEGFNGGPVEFSIDGHSILANVIVEIPQGSEEVFIEFEHHEGNEVHVHGVTSDIPVDDHHA